MAAIINGSINLDMIDKSKIVQGKKGKYLPITITINDDADTYGNQGPITLSQTKEEREAKSPKVYLGNIKVAWTNNVINKVDVQQVTPMKSPPTLAEQEDDDLPF